MSYLEDAMLTLILGDCVAEMAKLPADSVDAVVTDPPYGLEFMGKEWDRLGAGTETVDEGMDDSHPFRNGTRRVRYGQDARTMQAWHEAWAREAFRVAKPGAHLLAFGGTRTYHRLASAIEDAGWEIRDCLVWAYASGFPKSLNFPDGFGTALKPAWEPIVMARKPLIGTVAANRERHGTGALNIGATRIGTEQRTSRGMSSLGVMHDDDWAPGDVTTTANGRWPANLLLTDPIFDGGVPGVVGGGETNVAWSAASTEGLEPTSIGRQRPAGEMTPIYGDSGTYSRFFLVPKSSRSDREPLLRGTLAERFTPTMGNGIGGREHDPTLTKAYRENLHPTVKPLDLMRHLVRLVTPPGGTVLDCFLGSGTTAIAANAEGFRCIGIEREQEYLDIAVARLAHQPLGMQL